MGDQHAETALISTPLRSRPIRTWWVGAVLLGLLVAILVSWEPASARRLVTSIWPSGAGPEQPIDPDANGVLLGTRFQSSSAGAVTGIRFYRSRKNAGPHTGTLWSASGDILAKVDFPHTAETGWVSVDLPSAVRIVAGNSYVVSYWAPHGSYSTTRGAFSNGRVITNGPLTANAGVYSYDGTFPTRQWQSTAYFADVLFRRDATGSGGGTPSPTPTSPTSTPPVNTTPLLGLPRVPWNGGPGYYRQFPDAAANGWTDPGFFPIGIWWGVWSTDAEVKWDKAHGINTYIVTNPNADLGLLDRNGMSFIGGSVGGATRSSKSWVGDFLDDEVDGRYTPAEGQAFLKGLVDRLPDHKKIRYANYTGMVLSWLDTATSENYANNYTDAVSIDAYFYGMEYCSWPEYQGWAWLIPIPQDTCRTGNTYGQVVDMLRQRDKADGKRQAVWNFVEDVYGSDAYTMPVSPAQMKAAAWQTVIHEGRGIVWFNNAFGGPCSTGNAIRTAQFNPGYACAANIKGMGQVNNQIQRLAPIINTQSYRWNFGPGVATMLKAKDGYAYVFVGTDGHAGTKTLTLPNGIGGSSAVVIDEGRSVSVSGGRMVDDFPHEWTYHIYKIAL